MQLSYSLILSLLLALAPSCSSTVDPPGVSERPQHVGNGSSDCAPWPKSKLFPLIGPFFGPDPGPCKLSRAGVEYLLNYDISNVVTRLGSTDDTDVTTYDFDQGLLMTETRIQVSGLTTTTYEYTENLVRTVATSRNDAKTAYEYTLDDRGYVQTSKLLNPVASASQPKYYSYEYSGCQLHFRIAYDPNDAVNLDATAEYLYDDQGHVIERKSTITDELFDYSCW